MKFYLLPDLTVLSLPDWTIDVESSRVVSFDLKEAAARTAKEAADNVHFCTQAFILV